MLCEVPLTSMPIAWLVRDPSEIYDLKSDILSHGCLVMSLFFILFSLLVTILVTRTTDKD